MRNVEGARVTSADSTEPARFEHLRVNYRYGGTKRLEDEPVPASKRGAEARTAGREARKAEFKAILAAKGYVNLDDPAKPIIPVVRDAAGLRVGVTAKIARNYLKELIQEQEAQAS